MMAYRLNAAKRRRWPKLALMLAVALLVVVIAGVLGVKSIYERNLRAVNDAATEDITFVVQSGDSAEEIGDNLRAKNLIRSSAAFTQYVRSNDLGEAFIAGTYSLKQSYDVATIVAYLVEGRVNTGLFTILSGQTLAQIKQAFMEKGGFAEGQVDAALNPAVYAGHPALVDKPAEASLEGYLYPDSYEKIASTTPQTIVTLALDEMAEALTPEIRAGIAAQGLSVFSGITLASIVEREVSSKNPDDRPRVAQVFLKRLKIGMMLQSNATDSLSAEYDTYAIPALPPGPISNMSVSALQAVAAPSQTDFLYFVTGCDAVTRFSNTDAQHNALKAEHGIAEVTCS